MDAVGSRVDELMNSDTDKDSDDESEFVETFPDSVT